jgi:hypothetical protein
VERIGALEPEPLLPGGEPRPSSAGVWGAVVDRLPMVVTRGRIIAGVNVEDTRGLVAAIEAASWPARHNDPSARLIVGENGIVIPMGRDPGGHLQKRIDRGELHELTLAERKAYYAGEAVSHHA